MNRELQTRKVYFKKVTGMLTLFGSFFIGPSLILSSLTSSGYNDCEAICMVNHESICKYM